MPNSIIRRARVVIVDDEASNVRLLERILEMFGCQQVRSTTDSRLALNLCTEFQPDLVLLDLHMPHVDGFQIMEQLQNVLSDVYLPILVLTADITVETKRRALASGAKDLVTKPLDHSEVVLRIKNLLENRFLHLELQKQNLLLEDLVQNRTAQLEDTLNELRSTQEHIVKQERLRALGMMAGGIAHDFNNALTMVLGYGELLMPHLQQHAGAREITYLRNMVSAAQDATHVVGRLREFYRPATGNEFRTAVDLAATVEHVVSLTAPKWSSKSQADGVHIDVRLSLACVPPVSANAAELREVLTNLIFNSVDAMPEGGEIVVSTDLADGGVIVTVRDNGMGMTEEERERCLEPFFTTKGERGTGLGLAVVYGIIQRHEGRIEIESTKGSGTAFSFWLPEATVEDVQATPVIGRVDRSLRVLVVDDQEIICELISEYLQEDGHEAVVATSGLEAIEKFDRCFDLVITDHSMPGMNGVQLARVLKTQAAGLPVILLTGFGEEMQAQGQHPDSVDMVLGKPVSSGDLRKAVYLAIAGQGTVPAAAAVPSEESNARDPALLCVD
jgi:signal transduction histidine kinase